MENNGPYKKSELVFSVTIIADAIPAFRPTIVKNNPTSEQIPYFRPIEKIMK